MPHAPAEQLHTEPVPPRSLQARRAAGTVRGCENLRPGEPAGAGESGLDLDPLGTGTFGFGQFDVQDTIMVLGLDAVRIHIAETNDAAE